MATGADWNPYQGWSLASHPALLSELKRLNLGLIA